MPARARRSATGDGLRAWKQNSAGTRTYYLYDGTDPVAEMDSSGTIQAVNTFGANGLVSRHTTSTNASTFYTFDERGNVVQRLNSSGQVLSTDLYDAYGARTSTTAGVQPDPFGFGAQAGYYTDSETGLLLLTHRYYDPAAGRFVTRDPIGYGGGINLYSYTQNNPGNAMDPDGLRIILRAGTDDRNAYRQAKKYLLQDAGVASVFRKLEASKTVYHIQIINDGDDRFDPTRKNSVYWDPGSALHIVNNAGHLTGGTQSPALGLAHELDHAYLYDQDRGRFYKTAGIDDPFYTNDNEKYVITGLETKAAHTLGEGTRCNHDGRAYRVNGPTQR